MIVFGCLILINIDFYDFIVSFFSLVLGSIEKIYQTLKTVLHDISKHLKVCQKYSAAHLIFNSVFGNVVKDVLSCLIQCISMHLRNLKLFRSSVVRNIVIQNF